jgi:iron complex transport system ATP-binding protein
VTESITAPAAPALPGHAPDRPAAGAASLAFAGVHYVRDGRSILCGVDWVVRPGERWAVLGPNGSGKTSLLRLASLYERPSSGTVDVLGGRMGRVDVRSWRRRIGLTSAALTDQLRPHLAARDIVVTALHAALEPWWHAYDDDDGARPHAALARVGMDGFAGRAFATLSSGERQRVLLARALMTEPGLLLLDEPTAAMDLGGREQLVATLDALAADPCSPPMVLVTHHLEEVPARFTHALLLRGGEIVGKGPIDGVLTDERVSAAFGLAVAVSRVGGRWAARAG